MIRRAARRAFKVAAIVAFAYIADPRPLVRALWESSRNTAELRAAATAIVQSMEAFNG